jgi:hypothetical protein
MLNEKHNEGFGWKNKLGALTGLPGEAALQKDAAWEKLHSRLQEKPRRNKAVWYWAAACLLIALIIPLLITNKKENIVVRKDPPEKQQPVIVSTSPAAPALVETPKQVKKIKHENRSIKEQQAADLKALVKQEPVLPVEEKNINNIPVPAVTDTATVAATAIAKKKMTVVHINELDSPSPQFYTQPNYVQKNFKIKFRNGKSSSQTIASQQQYEGGFKIKLSPKN